MSNEITTRDESRELATPRIVNESLPEYMQEYMRENDDLGVSELSQFVRPPRLKVVQKQSKAPLSDMFDRGDVVTVPDMTLIAAVEKTGNNRPGKQGTPFHFTPLMFFSEYCTWNPIELSGDGPAIAERTTDPRSALAAKARNFERRSEPMVAEDGSAVVGQNGQQLYLRHVHHLNFIVAIWGVPELEYLPVVMSYSRSTYSQGESLCSLIKLRRAPAWGCVFEAQTQYQSNDKGDWYGLPCSNPSEESGVAPVVDEETFRITTSLYESLREQRSNIVVDYEDVDAESSGAGGANSDDIPF